MALTVALVEDDAHYRGAFHLIVAATDSLVLVNVYARAEDALADFERGQRWDVLVMDLDLPGISGTEATRRIRDMDADQIVVVLTAFDDPPRILQAIRSGAEGYLLKNAEGDELIDYLALAAQGGAPMTPGVARSVLELLRQAAPRPRSEMPHLSPRERDVLEGLVRGLAYKEIAWELQVSIETIRGYVRTLYRKLRVHSATEAVSKALRQGWID
ncbi:MAG: response regulator transcription factor [Myxococcota bacterium]